MMTTETATYDDVRDLIVATLGLEADRRETLKPWTAPLFGGIPEFDSLAVVTLAGGAGAAFRLRDRRRGIHRRDIRHGRLAVGISSTAAGV